jgi:hypothetical protein
VKDKNCNLLVDSHNILNSWRNCFSSYWIYKVVSGFRQIEIHLAKQLVNFQAVPHVSHKSCIYFFYWCTFICYSKMLKDILGDCITQHELLTLARHYSAQCIKEQYTKESLR